MHSLATLVLVGALAACGGKSAPKAGASTDGHDHAMAGSAIDGHDHDHQTAGSADPATSPTPVTPAVTEPKPTEPVSPDPATLNAEFLAAEKAAFEKAKPVFDKFCAKCHAKSGSKWSQKKGDHFDMTTYPFGGHHAMEISSEIRKSLGMTGKKPTMPADNKGAVKGDDLVLIAAWADAFDKAHAAGAHEGMAHEHGHDHGPKQGHDHGQKQGHDHGPKQGQQQGHDHGPKQGQKQGHDHGPKQGEGQGHKH